MSLFSIHQITRYEYSRPVKESLNQIKIHPIADEHQEILQHDVLISGNPSVHLFSDYWGNRTGIFTIAEPHQLLTIESKLLVRTKETDLNFLNTFRLKDEVVPSNDLLLTELKLSERIRLQHEIEQIAAVVLHEDKTATEIIQHCSEYIYKNFSYIKGITDYETTVDEILEHKSGVCQDFAHVLLQLLRFIGIPCRYVSGYICPNKNGMRGEGATHAWVEVWITGYGWAGIDPTNNVWVQGNHIKLAVGRDFNDCTPVKGTFKGPARQLLSVYVSVGYEDGQVFEEMNNVTIESQQEFAATPEEAVLQFNADLEQQQQQQQ